MEPSRWLRLVLVAGTLSISYRAMGQEVEFGSSSGSAIEVDEDRMKRSEGAAKPRILGKSMDDIKRANEELANWKFKIIPASTESSDRSVLGVDARAGYESNEYSLRYLSIDADGANSRVSQYRARFKHTFSETDHGIQYEVFAQYSATPHKYGEVGVYSNATAKLSETNKIIATIGWLWRDPNAGVRVDDADFSLSFKRKFSEKLSMATTYRTKNEISGEDDFSVGADYGNMSLLVGKHWVATINYVYQFERQSARRKAGSRN